MIPFLSAMIGLLTVGLLTGNRPFLASTGVLLINWLVQVIFVQISGEQFPWLFFIPVDYLSGIAIFAIGMGRWRAAIMFIYVVQILCHAAYGLSAQGPWQRYYYWYSLTYTGWAQLTVLGGWMLYDLGRRFACHRGGAPSHSSVSSGQPEP